MDVLKQVEATHATHATHTYQFTVKLLRIIEYICLRAAPGSDKQGSERPDLSEDNTSFFDTLYLRSFVINAVSCEISCKCYGGGDEHTVLGILKILGSYDWDEKVALAMAAFALNCGEFQVMARHSPTDSLVKSVEWLKQLPKIYKQEQNDTLKSELEALNNLIKAMLDVTKCIVELMELPAQYIRPELETASPNIHIAVYWTIRSILACAAQIMRPVPVPTMSHGYISSFAENLKSRHTLLKEQLDLCYTIIDDKKRMEAYEELKRLMETPHTNNMNVLRELIYAKDVQEPLVTRKKPASLGVLKDNNVLLLISHPDASLNDELFILKEMYQESRKDPVRPECQYEVVWMPVLDKTVPWPEEKENKFETLRSMMLWYSINYSPSMVDQAVIRYIKEFWNFKKKPILVVLDPQGKVVNTNALHMIWIWGSLAFPFSSAREKVLWTSEKSWGHKLLVDNIDPIIPVWVDDRKFICLYGGEDKVWIQNFIENAMAVAEDIGLPLEMIYVGKSNPKDKVKKNMDTITEQKLSHTLKDIRLIRFFWVRLESMWHSKLKHCENVKTDLILQEIVKMLTFDGSERCWAFICRGSEIEIATAKGEIILESFGDFNEWKKNANDKGFIPALNERLNQIYSSGHCNCLILPETTGPILESLVCYECKRPMEEFIMYRCCNE